jgi:hypothetical protein
VQLLNKSAAQAALACWQVRLNLAIRTVKTGPQQESAIGVPVASVRPFNRLDPINDPPLVVIGQISAGFIASVPFKVASWGPIASKGVPPGSRIAADALEYRADHAVWRTCYPPCWYAMSLIKLVNLLPYRVLPQHLPYRACHL